MTSNNKVMSFTHHSLFVILCGLIFCSRFDNTQGATCSSESCHVNATCYITNNQIDCTCMNGFYGNGTTCYDINECLNNCTCHSNQTCYNTIGSYTCMSSDLNECEDGSHHCHMNATCHNIIGSYNCSCKTGFKGNGTHCDETPRLSPSQVTQYESSTNASTASSHTPVSMVPRTIVSYSGKTSSSFIIQMVSPVSPTSTQATTPSSSEIPSNISRGFCAPYTGTTCRAVLDQTLTAFNESERFFDRKYGINKTEEYAGTIVNFVSQQKAAKPQCERLILVIFCQQTFLACLPNGKPISLCREDCEKLSQECSADLNRLIGSTSAITGLVRVDFFHLSLPTNCSRYPSGKTGNNSCYYTGLFDHRLPADTPSSDNVAIVVVVVVVVVIVIVVMILAIGIVYYRRRKQQVSARDENPHLESMPGISLENVHSGPAGNIDGPEEEYFSWREIPRDDLTMGKFLGEGEFSKVVQAVWKDEKSNSHIAVAVKTVKDIATEDDRKKLFEELKLLADVTQHPNVVNLLGACSKGGPLWVIVEFCKHGNLLSYIRNNRKTLSEDDRPFMSSLDLVTRARFAYDVSKGMSHLEKMKIVHRDLAARNVLLGRNKIAKVSDFGLSRDIYEAGLYQKSAGGKLPVRWMAIESLQEFTYSSKSDVWSFGVLFWEIETAGLIPYAGIADLDLLKHLQRGYRLPKPSETLPELYEIMKTCWVSNPEVRPSFEELRIKLESFLEQNSDCLQVENKDNADDGVADVLNYVETAESE